MAACPSNGGILLPKYYMLATVGATNAPSEFAHNRNRSQMHPFQKWRNFVASFIALEGQLRLQWHFKAMHSSLRSRHNPDKRGSKDKVLPRCSDWNIYSHTEGFWAEVPLDFFGVVFGWRLFKIRFDCGFTKQWPRRGTTR